MPQGYLRFPHLWQDRIVFVAEDDLWLVSSEGGRAERLTAGLGEMSHPRFSPDGQWLAFVADDEGPTAVYVMPTQGGEARRLTFQGGKCRVHGWSPTGSEILFASNAGQFDLRGDFLYTITPGGGLPRPLPFGIANAISYGPHAGVVIGRNTNEYSRWKRYHGGTIGQLWCDPTGDGRFERLLREHTGNLTAPCWVGERIYFLSDASGVGNLCSCTPLGEDIRQETEHQEFYARHLASDGRRLVYHSGAELFLFDPAIGQTQHLEVTLPSSRTQRTRTFVSARSFLDTYALHPQGHSVALTTRGKAFSMSNWEGAVRQYGEQDGVRYQFLQWLNDGTRLIAVTDAPGRDALILFEPSGDQEPQLLSEIEVGRVVRMEICPTRDQVALTNHRHELLVVDLDTETVQVLDRSPARRILGICWSPDGRWLAYGFALSSRQTAIKLCHLESGETHQITEPVLHDIEPSFDPDGRYLYFLGKRSFTPVEDQLQTGFGFAHGIKPYLIVLQRDQPSPFRPVSIPTESTMQQRGEGWAESMRIDLHGICERVVAFPVEAGRYRDIRAIHGKVLLLASPVQGALSNPSARRKRVMTCYDVTQAKTEWLLEGVRSFDLSRDGTTVIVRVAKAGFRVWNVGKSVETLDAGDQTSRQTGWLDLGRISVSVHPPAEWRQMLAEAWRLQREYFWDAEMSGIDWDAIYAQYAPLVERVGSRDELSDLLWEMQGELGTSHAYESGGDYRESPDYAQGFLGVDWISDAEQNRTRIERIIMGDPTESRATSPFTAPGLHVSAGDAVLAINGQHVTQVRTPQELLVNQAGKQAEVTVEDGTTQQIRRITVTVLGSERAARYREWVENNRRLVHERSAGRVGYLHIPDMEENGYAEFHRGYLAEYDFPALIVDVRWNRGGYVCELLLEKLARRRLGRIRSSPWQEPRPFPPEAPRGPMVALCNEYTASNGDIFCHSFKLMKLGPLIGTRTWGGVIGYITHGDLVDGTQTTQPEYPGWFEQGGWSLENYGVEPDIEVEMTPQDSEKNADPQLYCAIVEAMRLINESVPSEEERCSYPARRDECNRHV